MVIVPTLPETPQALLERIAMLEVHRERLRSIGLLHPARGRQIAGELSELRQALAVSQARQESEAR